MASYMTVNAQTAEDQLIKMAWQLKDYYEDRAEVANQGGAARYGNRVQMEVDYVNQQVSVRFKLDVKFTQGDATCFKGIEPRLYANNFDIV